MLFDPTPERKGAGLGFCEHVLRLQKSLMKPYGAHLDFWIKDLPNTAIGGGPPYLY
jgi:hypothetical protein